MSHERPAWHMMDLSDAERRAVARGPIRWADGVELPSGWRWGAFVSGATWWAMHADGRTAHVEVRPDMSAEDCDASDFDDPRLATSILAETHPEYMYAVVSMDGGYVQLGRPIRGNFYCYKLRRHHAPVVEKLLHNATTNATTQAVVDYLSRHELPWSQSVDDQGYEA